MSLRIPKAGDQLFKSGYTFASGIEDAVIRCVDALLLATSETLNLSGTSSHRNIQAVAELTDLVRTSFGPQGRNKMVLKYVVKLTQRLGMAAVS